MLPSVTRGGAIVTPSFTVRQDNVATLMPMLEERLSMYRTAIVARGYKNVAGSYRARATPSCARTGSVWAGGIRERPLGRLFDLSQDGFTVQLAAHGASGADAAVFSASGIVVESVLVIADPVNSDFSFLADILAEAITARPNTARILEAWPNWAPAPARSDLDTCMVTLAPSRQH